MGIKADLATLPVGVLIVLGALVALEIALDVVALIDLYRRPAGTIVSGNRWIWVAVIVLVNPVGAIVYLAIGRIPAQIVEQAAGPKRSSSDIADALYGTSDEPKRL